MSKVETERNYKLRLEQHVARCLIPNLNASELQSKRAEANSFVHNSSNNNLKLDVQRPKKMPMVSRKEVSPKSTGSHRQTAHQKAPPMKSQISRFFSPQRAVPPSSGGHQHSARRISRRSQASQGLSFSGKKPKSLPSFASDCRRADPKIFDALLICPRQRRLLHRTGSAVAPIIILNLTSCYLLSEGLMKTRKLAESRDV